MFYDLHSDLKDLKKQEQQRQQWLQEQQRHEQQCLKSEEQQRKQKEREREGQAERERILAEARRLSDQTGDGTATWSISTLRRALQEAPDGLPLLSTSTIWYVLKHAGWSWKESRGWYKTRHQFVECNRVPYQ